jgi:hypothetical protein
METKEIIKPKGLNSLNIFLAISILKNLYIDADIREIDEDKKEKIEKMEKDSSKVLIGFKGISDYNFRNYYISEDKHSPLMAVLENELPSKNYKKIKENETLFKTIKLIDEEQRFGYHHLEKEYGLNRENSLLKTIYESILKNAYNSIIGNILIANSEIITIESYLNALEKVIEEIRQNREQIINSLEEELKLTYAEREKLTNIFTYWEDSKKQIRKDIVLTEKGLYEGFVFYIANNTYEFIENLRETLKEKIKEWRIQKSVRKFELYSPNGSIKVGIYTGTDYKDLSIFLKQGYNLLLIADKQNPEDFILLKNTLYDGIDIENLSRNLGKVKFINSSKAIVSVDFPNISNLTEDRKAVLLENKIREIYRKQTIKKPISP